MICRDACWYADHMTKKILSAVKQVKTKWMGFGVIKKLVIEDRGRIMYTNHFAQLLTIGNFEALKYETINIPRPTVEMDSR